GARRTPGLRAIQSNYGQLLAERAVVDHADRADRCAVRRGAAHDPTRRSQRAPHLSADGRARARAPGSAAARRRVILTPMQTAATAPERPHAGFHIISTV